MLVLLITFLLTASSFESESLTVPIPQVKDTQQIEKNATIVSVTEVGKVLWPETAWSELPEEAAFAELLKQSPQKVLALAVHKQANYGALFKLLQAASDAGWPEVILLTEEVEGA